MNERRPNEDMNEMLERLEREFNTRAQPPQDDAPSPGQQVIDATMQQPQRVRLTLPLAKPRLVYALLAANVIMYILTSLLASRYGFGGALDILGWKENSKIDAGQYWRLLTPMVLHGGLTHLLFNSWALYSLGTEAERVFGTVRFAAVYLLAGLAGSIASYMFNPAAPSVGASGAIFGLFGALAAFSYTSRSLIGWEASRMQLGQMATLVMINLAFGFSIPNIDNSAHIGGLIVGGLAGLGLAPRYAVDRRSYMPSIERRDPPLAGWATAGGILVVLIVWFVVGRPF
jgi:rhomboid protease GluP